MKRHLLTALLVLTLGSISIWAVSRPVPRTARARPANGDDAELRALVEESRRANQQLALVVDELRASVESLRTQRTVVRDAASGETTLAVIESDDTTAELAELRALVQEIQATLERHVEDTQTPEQRALALKRAMEEQPEANWVSLGELLELHQMDEERARMDVSMLSMTNIVERYGKPQLTWGGDKGLTWVFGEDYMPEKEAYRLQLMFHFVDGLVTRFWVERN